jgi:2-methylcitrate dehydratase PrpD
MCPDILSEQSASLVTSLANFVHCSGYDSLPVTIRLIARQHLFDTIGCCLSATRLDTSRALACYLLADGGDGQATAIGVPKRLPAAQAAFMNGLLARSLEFDDMAMPDLHPSGSIVPVVLSLCEWRSLSGRDAVTATAIGLELCLRLGRAGFDQTSRMSRFLRRGQDATAICGSLAAAG